jgi:SAM-dependent methyltransferase
MKDRFARQYAALEEWHWWFRGRRRILAAVLGRELGHAPVARRIASLGCGPAGDLAWLAGTAGRGGQLVGVDLDPRHGRTRAPGSAFVAGRVEQLPFRSGSFDVVLALDVLEHLDDDAGGLGEAARLVAPGGLLVVTVPAFPSLWGRQDRVSEHRRRYTRRGLAEVHARAGLPGPRITYFNALLFPLVATVRWTRRGGSADEAGSDFDDNRPGLVNELLAAIFAAERHLVGRLPMPPGVSLLALVRR